MTDAQYRQNIENLNHKLAGAEKLPKYYSLAARTVQKAGYPQLVPDDLNSRTMRFAGRPETVFPTYSLYKIFVPNMWEGATFQNGKVFQGKIVLVGPQGDWTKDELDTPWGLMNGAEIHLNAINSLLEGKYLYPASTGLVYATVIGAGLIALFLAMTLHQIAWRFLATVGVAAGYVLAMIWSYNGPGWLLPAVAPLSVFCGATGTGFIYDFVLTQIEKIACGRPSSATIRRTWSSISGKYGELQADARRHAAAR